VCGSVHALKNNDALNLYTRQSIKTNNLVQIKNIVFLIEDFSFCFVCEGCKDILEWVDSLFCSDWLKKPVVF